MRNLRTIANDAAEESKGVAWPIIALAVGVMIIWSSCIALSAAGVIPIWLAAVINTYCLFAAYTPIHEGTHRNIHGDRENLAWVNRFIAYVLCIPIFLSYTMQRYVHLRHHAHVNDPRLDNDYWIHSKHAPVVVLKSFVYLLHVNHYAIKTWLQEKGGARNVVVSLIEQAVPWALGAWLIAAGHGDVFLFVWLIPALVGVSFLLILSNWIVHREPEGAGQFGNTRILVAPRGFWGDVMTNVCMGGNYHLIHHLFPRIPFYKHRAFWDRHAEALKAAGAKVYPHFHGESVSPKATTLSPAE